MHGFVKISIGQYIKVRKNKYEIKLCILVKTNSTVLRHAIYGGRSEDMNEKNNLLLIDGFEPQWVPNFSFC